MKQFTDQGRVDVTASDSSGSGKLVNFSKSFVDVDSIQLTVQAGSDARYAIYDFEDAANPEDGFRIFLYTTNGTPTSGTVDFTVRGV